MRCIANCTTCKLLRIALGVALTAMLVSCGAKEAGAPASMIPQYTLPPVVEAAQPAQGGNLRFPIPPQNANALNPLKVDNVELFNLNTLIYEQPVRIGTDGKAKPELAETWNVDETGTVWTFKLREGVQWQGGYGEFTSEDVIYTIGLIRTYNADESSYAIYNGKIESCDAPDAHTVTVTLKEPGRLAIYFMTFPVLCKAYCATGRVDSLTPIGTGPYEVTEYDPQTQMLLSVNPLWWKQPPYIQSLTALCYENSDDELTVFEQDMLDFVTTSELTVDTYKNTYHTSVDYLTQYYDCIVPNTASGLFSNASMRQAVGYALDRRDIIAKALLGHAVATDYPIPPDSFLSGSSSNMYEYNQQKARELLESAGWKDRDSDGICESVEGTQINDLEVSLLIPLNKENTYRHDVAENIKAQLLECGIVVTIIEAQSSEDYLQRLQSGNFELALCSFYLDDYPDISFMVGTGGSHNYGAFSDAAMDQLLVKCKSALDEPSMVKAFSAMEQRFIETVPQIGLYFRTNALLYDMSITIAGDIRDLNLYTTIPGWYLYIKNDAGEAVLKGEMAPTPTPSSDAVTTGSGS